MTCIKPKFFLKILLLTSIFFLNGCSSFVWNSHGIIAREECFLIFISFLMMLLVILPVIFMTVYFSKKYQCNNKDQIYAPNWCHSNKIEMIIWFVPITIILFLSFLSWNYTHKLEPKKSISSFYQPIKIDVISLNWKWFFIYPDYHIATVNEIVIPINRPIIFRITSNSVMNSFFIPSLGSQIYAMPGMITKLNLISNHTGIFKGISSNYSGSGFSDMKFTVNSVSDNVMFHQWIKKIKNNKNTLNMFKNINIISEIEKNCFQKYFSGIDKNLFDQVANQYSIKNFFIIH